MKNYQLVPYAANDYNEALTNFEIAVHHNRVAYSLHQLAFAEAISAEQTDEAINKALILCQLAGINHQHHFRKVYVYDTQLGTLRSDWKMSRNGFNLVMMHLPLEDEKRARWLWRLTAL